MRLVPGGMAPGELSAFTRCPWEGGEPSLCLHVGSSSLGGGAGVPGATASELFPGRCWSPPPVGGRVAQQGPPLGSGADFLASLFCGCNGGGHAATWFRCLDLVTCKPAGRRIGPERVPCLRAFCCPHRASRHSSSPFVNISVHVPATTSYKHGLASNCRHLALLSLGPRAEWPLLSPMV